MSTPISFPKIIPGEPAWGVALLFPPQGSWTEADYFNLDSGRLVEFSNGCIEVLDVPTIEHQRIVRFLFQMLNEFVRAANAGEVFFAPLPVRLWEQKFREPDLVFVGSGRSTYKGYPDGADLVMEVVSSGEANRQRDMQTKLDEYHRAKIDEYWLIDPQLSMISVYDNTGVQPIVQIYRQGEVAISKLLTGFSLDVSCVFASGAAKHV